MHSTPHDRFPASHPLASPEARACRDHLIQQKGSLPGPYGLLVHSPAVAQAFAALSTALWQGDLPRRITEGLFLHSAQRQQCRYQWVRHVDKAREAGLAASVIAQLGAGDTPSADADPAFHAAWELATALHQSGPVPDALFARVQQQFGTKALAELTAFCGFAAMVAHTLRVRQPGLPADSNAPF